MVKKDKEEDRKKKMAAPVKKRSAPRHDEEDDDDSSVDSRGNLRGLIAYSSEPDEESEEESVPVKKSKKSKKVKSRLPLKRVPLKKRKPEPESESDDEEDDEGETLGSQDTDEEEGDFDDFEGEEDDTYEDEERSANLVISFGAADDGADRMIPQRHNMKKESASVKQFVKLLTAPLEDNTIDTQIDQFKALPELKQKELLTALENRPTVQDTGVNLMLRILTLKLPVETQALVLAKYNSLQSLDPSSGEYFKLRNWLDKVVSIPFGLYKEIAIKLEDGSEACAKFMQGAQKSLNDAVYGQDDTKLQILQYITTKIANPSGRGTSLLLAGPPGIGKCHAIDTPILMADGHIKLVQNIQVGDTIMGDDSNPRNVLSLGSGKDMMYDIIPVKGEKYTVNSEHIMCLKYSSNPRIRSIQCNNITSYKVQRFDNKTYKLKYKTFHTRMEAETYMQSLKNELVEISVKNYIALPNDIKSQLKGYRRGVEFAYQQPDFDPYIIGLWLGDGSNSGSKISNQDAAVLKYLNSTLPHYNLMMSYHAQYDYNIRAITTGKTDNLMLMTLKKYNMINNKHIPDHYKINNRAVRLQVLAGLLDSDGSLAPGTNTYEISQVHKPLVDDILYLARSLGFAAYVNDKKTTWTYKHEKKEGYAYRITISGNINEIPVKIHRKKANARLQTKDVLVTGITVKEAGHGDYYGFTLDGNHKYLMGDFTVTHNTSVIKNGIAKALGLPFQFISLGGDSDASTYTGHQLVYESSHCGKIVNSLIASKSMSTIILFDEVDKISATPKGEEVQNMLIHLTDPASNEAFEDKYLSGVPIDLSKVIFVFSANDVTKIDRVLLDRLMTIELKGYDLKQKTTIAEQYLLPAALKDVNLVERVAFGMGVVAHIIEQYAKEELGVRELKRSIEQIVQKINMLRLYNDKALPFHIKDFTLPFTVKKEHVDLFLKKKEGHSIPFGMYT
uniref:DOD-type homing endonuclease domain-containing protein n=1 Tax=viral metagenome TaxID=1070528 RepID=A0A6C0K561_9ZZZZ